MTYFQINISLGELIDRISILELKLFHATEETIRSSIAAELSSLQNKLQASPITMHFTEQFEHLREINKTLWQLENDIRRLEKDEDFGHEYIYTARAISKNNDQRTRIKHQINTLSGSKQILEKFYS